MKQSSFLNTPISILDKGSVTLLDYMGDDHRIVDAARISTDNHNPSTRDEKRDKKLIDYLMRNDHTSPFEQVLFTFHIKAPIFVARQWLRHRTARVNEISGRYVELANEFYLPAALRAQAKNNHQASDASIPVEDEDKIIIAMADEQTVAGARYNAYVSQGVAREMARINLPLSTYTEWYWNIDLHNLFHFIRLRLHHHAQKEIQEYAKAILKVVMSIVPWATDAWLTHKFHGVSLSAQEVTALQSIMDRNGNDLADILGDRGARILRAKLGPPPELL